VQKYLITSKEFYTDKVSSFSSILKKQLIKHKPSYALFRDKTNQNYALQAESFVKICKEFEEIKSFIHRDVKLAKKLNVSGVHLTSNQFDEIADAKKLGLEVIISTHTHKEVLKAQEFGADAVTYSPIFLSPNKGKAKGIDNLKELIKKSEIKIFALGGIIEASQIKMIEKTKAYGFASIRYFYR